MQIRPRRSVLYMPGSNARALEKAKSIAADGLILDLEDAVAPEAKETARKQVYEAVKAGGYGNRELVIRINAFDTPWGQADLEAAAAAAPDAVLLPKPGAGAASNTAVDHGPTLLLRRTDHRVASRPCRQRSAPLAPRAASDAGDEGGAVRRLGLRV